MCSVVPICEAREARRGEARRVNGSAYAAGSGVAMLSIGGVQMTPAAVHEQVTDWLIRLACQGLRSRVRC